MLGPRQILSWLGWVLFVGCILLIAISENGLVILGGCALFTLVFYYCISAIDADDWWPF